MNEDKEKTGEIRPKSKNKNVISVIVFIYVIIIIIAIFIVFKLYTKSKNCTKDEVLYEGVCQKCPEGASKTGEGLLAKYPGCKCTDENKLFTMDNKCMNTSNSDIHSLILKIEKLSTVSSKPTLVFPYINVSEIVTPPSPIIIPDKNNIGSIKILTPGLVFLRVVYLGSDNIYHADTLHFPLSGPTTEPWFYNMKLDPNNKLQQPFVNLLRIIVRFDDTSEREVKFEFTNLLSKTFHVVAYIPTQINVLIFID